MKLRGPALVGSIAASLALAVACNSELNLDLPSDDAGTDAARTASDAGVFDSAPPPFVDGSVERYYENALAVTGLALDDERVYWTTNLPDGGLFACPKSGCGPEPMLLLGQRDRPASIALAGGRAYWTEVGSPDIHWCRVEACLPNEPVLAAGLAAGGPIATDDAGVYALDRDRGRLVRCTYDGACETVERDAGTTAIATSGSELHTAGDGIDLLAVDDDVVYWTRDGFLYACTGNPCEEVFVAGPFDFGAIAVDADGLWFSDVASSNLWRVAR